MSEEAPHGLVEVEVGIARFPPRGRDDTRRGGTWDLIYAPWKCWGARARVRGWYRSDQSGRAGEWWWSGAERHLACINGQTTTGKARIQCMHTFMTGYKCTGCFFFFFLEVGAFIWSSTHLHTGWPWHKAYLYRYTALRMRLWHLNGPSSIDIKAVHRADLLFSALQRTIQMDWHLPSFCPLSGIVKVFWVWKCNFLGSSVCRQAFLLYVQSRLTWLLFILHVTPLLCCFFFWKGFYK